MVMDFAGSLGETWLEAVQMIRPFTYKSGKYKVKWGSMSIFTNINTKTIITAFSWSVPGNIARGLSADRDC